MMVLSDFFDSILKRKLRYFLFLVQMILIFIIIQYSFNLVNEYRLYNNKLEEVSSKKILFTMLSNPLIRKLSLNAPLKNTKNLKPK